MTAPPARYLSEVVGVLTTRTSQRHNSRMGQKATKRTKRTKRGKRADPKASRRETKKSKVKVAVAAANESVLEGTQLLRIERAKVTEVILAMVLGEERVALACELATTRTCTVFDVIRRAFDEHVAKAGKGDALERIHQKARRG